MPVAALGSRRAVAEGSTQPPQTGPFLFPYGKGMWHLVSLPAAGSLKPVFCMVWSKEKIKCRIVWHYQGFLLPRTPA